MENSPHSSKPSSGKQTERETQPPDASELLRGDNPREVLRNIGNGDPLELGRRAIERLEQRAYLIDAERLAARVLARVAHDADLFFEEGTPFETWITPRLDKSIDELLREDFEEEHRGVLLDPDDDRYQFLIDLVGLEAALCRRAALAVNDLDDDTRMAFSAVVLRGKTMEACVEEGLGTLEQLRERIRAAFLAISLIVDDDENERGGL